jgi:shikimate dehydrogenase
MQNIVLIGMPGCGKSTIGRLISQHTGKELIDMDEEIIKRAGMNIPEIFEKYGEKHFRDLESQVAADLGKERNLVIATGGGAVLRPENVDHLRQNAVVIHILRPTCNLSTDGRPLSKDINTLMEMEKVRMPIYQSATDIEYDNSKSKSLAEIAEEVMILLKGGK